MIKREVSSTMLRAKLTVDLIAHNMNITVSEDYDLEEGNPELHFHCDRFDRAYEKYLPSVEVTGKYTDVLICHGNIISYLGCR